MHEGIGANIKKKDGKVSGQGGNMLSGQPVVKGDLVEAIVFEGKVSDPKNISFGPHTFITKQFYCNIIKNILFFKVKIFRDKNVEALTNNSRGKLIDMTLNKDFLKLWFPWITMLSLRLT